MRIHILTSVAAAAALSGAALSVHAAQAPAQQQPPPSQAVVQKGRAPVSNRGPAGQAAAAPDRHARQRAAPHRARGSPRAARDLPAHDPGAGGYFDPAGQAGLATVTATMMREGTANRSSAQLSEQLETMAASVGVSTGMSSTEASVSAARA
jgi:hypothetical protein